MADIWVLADDRPGNRAQCIGVAERLGLPFDIKEIRYSKAADLPNILRGASLIGLNRQESAYLEAPWPSVVIAAGRRTAPIARYIKAKSPETRLVQLMWPDVNPSAFDSIVLPAHDREYGRIRKSKEPQDLPNVLRVLGAPHRITPELLEAAKTKWQRHLTSWPAPRIAVMVGGGNKHGNFTADDWSKLGGLLAQFAKNTKGSLLISTSRRTGAEGETLLRKAVEQTDHKFYGTAEKDEENPYLGYLALADAIIVTADSIAMCSEACATGKPVYLFEPSALAPKHTRFANTLIATGYVFPLTPDFTDAIRIPLKKAALDSAATVAEHVKKRFLNAS